MTLQQLLKDLYNSYGITKGDNNFYKEVPLFNLDSFKEQKETKDFNFALNIPGLDPNRFIVSIHADEIQLSYGGNKETYISIPFEEEKHEELECEYKLGFDRYYI